MAGVASVRPGPQVRRLLAEQVMSRGLDIATASKTKSTTVLVHGLDVAAWYTFPTAVWKEGIHPESGHRCRCHFSFLRSLFRPGASETPFCRLSNSGSPRGFCGFRTGNDGVGLLLKPCYTQFLRLRYRPNP